MYGVIYKVLNKLNGKIYVGQTTQFPKQRFYCHKAGRSILADALRKYGYPAFEFEVIDSGCSKGCLAYKERLWISHFKCRAPLGYNISEGGESGGVGCKASLQTRLRMSQSHKIRHANQPHPMLGKKHSLETRELLSARRKGKKPGTFGKSMSEATKLKMSIAHRGIKHTEESKAKIAASRIGRKFPRKAD